jgi:hypothetical protein
MFKVSIHYFMIWSIFTLKERSLSTKIKSGLFHKEELTLFNIEQKRRGWLVNAAHDLSFTVRRKGLAINGAFVLRREEPIFLPARTLTKKRRSSKARLAFS